MAVQNFDEETLRLCDLRGKIKHELAMRDSCAAQLAEINENLGKAELAYETALAAWAVKGTDYKGIAVAKAKA
jgi:hypothetical protein